MTFWEYLIEKIEFLSTEYHINLSVHIENGRVTLKAKKYHPSGQMLYCEKDYSLLALSEAYADIFDLGLATMVADVLRAYSAREALHTMAVPDGSGAPHYTLPAAIKA